MARILAYTSPAAGHLFPLVPGLLALRRARARRPPAHRRAAARRRARRRPRRPAGRPRDRGDRGRRLHGRARRRQAAARHRSLLARGPLERADLDRAIAEVEPDVLLVDMNSYGAAVAAQASGLPWAIAMPSLLPLPARASRRTGSAWRRRAARAGACATACCGSSCEPPYAKAMLPRLNALRADAGPARAALADRARPRAGPAARPHGRAARVPAQRPAREGALRRRPALGPARRGARPGSTSPATRGCS